eukprot:Rhum_TRINITY_DN18915_c0_g1::Rhum_TRINITY_DN18915_c0_g1_i1::g.168779::m.168779
MLEDPSLRPGNRIHHSVSVTRQHNVILHCVRRFQALQGGDESLLLISVLHANDNQIVRQTRPSRQPLSRRTHLLRVAQPVVAYPPLDAGVRAPLAPRRLPRLRLQGCRRPCHLVRRVYHAEHLSGVLQPHASSVCARVRSRLCGPQGRRLQLHLQRLLLLRRVVQLGGGGCGSRLLLLVVDGNGGRSTLLAHACAGLAAGWLHRQEVAEKAACERDNQQYEQRCACHSQHCQHLPPRLSRPHPLPQQSQGHCDRRSDIACLLLPERRSGCGPKAAAAEVVLRQVIDSHRAFPPYPLASQ